MTTPVVGIIMGSASDIPVIEKGVKVLDELGIPYEVAIASAHRTPRDVEGYAANAPQRGIKVIIAAAGLSAALPGVVAAATTLPVIGVPVKGGALDGLDALLSVTQMPPGIPVGSVGLNASLNACLMAARIIAINDTDLSKRLEEWSKKRASAVAESRTELANLPAAPEVAYRL
ncbi:MULTISPECIES: 5-(carboxyamino)imidazole ribonucleotide mutase [Synergistaceae]|uniref:5-(carboxyamino)imidazole ribonucleotide mutase n=1 Tax=Synergistaceae TaxID=649777 RepID=UPI0026896BE7|nr:5-(carboxyamino)imidazole ribonucleotide mutase [Synergistaceae bacterium DZ-S4]